MSGLVRKLNRAAILDTNLVLLFLVAKTDRTLIRSYKRVQMFTDRDVSLREQLLNSFQSILTTPQILTEVSNLLGQAPSHARPKLRDAFAEYIAIREERYVRSAELALHDAFLELGLTDCSLEEASLQHTVITMDYRLAGKIHTMGSSR